jgi:hypothetical protein
MKPEEAKEVRHVGIAMKDVDKQSSANLGASIIVPTKNQRQIAKGDPWGDITPDRSFKGPLKHFSDSHYQPSNLIIS